MTQMAQMTQMFFRRMTVGLRAAMMLAVVMMLGAQTARADKTPAQTVVATVQHAGQEPVEYTNLEAAFAAAQNNDEIKLQDDCALAADQDKGLLGKIIVGNGTDAIDVTLDLNGHTISGSADGLVTIATNARLRVTDGGTGGSIATTGAKAVMNVGVLDVSGGSISGSIGIESAASSECHLLALPTFNCTVADISLAKDQKISFSGAITTAPTKKIKVKVANTAPYMFTDGYGNHMWNDVDGTLDPETVFEYYDKDAGLSFDLDGNGSNGADVVIARRYALSSENVRFFLFFNDGLYPVNKAAEGQTVFVSPIDEKCPAGKYFTGVFTSNQATVEPVKDEVNGIPPEFCQFTMPAMAVTVTAVVADKEEFTIDLTTDAPLVISYPIVELLCQMKVDEKSCYLCDDDVHCFLDLNVDGVNDLEVKSTFDETAQQDVYSIERLNGDNVFQTNCRFTLDTSSLERYNSLFFIFESETNPDGSTNTSISKPLEIDGNTLYNIEVAEGNLFAPLSEGDQQKTLIIKDATRVPGNQMRGPDILVRQGDESNMMVVTNLVNNIPKHEIVVKQKDGDDANQPTQIAINTPSNTVGNSGGGEDEGNTGGGEEEGNTDGGVSVGKYKILFMNYDKKLLQSSVVEYGQLPNYTGNIPMKPSDDQYTYYFVGLSPDIHAVTEDATYTAKYKEKPKVNSHIVSESEDTYTMDSSGTLTFVFKRTENDNTTFNHFSGVLVDGKVVPERDNRRNEWTAKNGSRGATAEEENGKTEIVSGQEYRILSDGYIVLNIYTAGGPITITDIIIRRPGDANNDGFLDAVDLVEMINAKNGKASEHFNLTNADIDRDGEITQDDIDFVVEMIMK